MTKKLKKSVTDPSQMNLFDLLKQEQVERLETAPGRLCISAKLQAAVRRAVKNAGMSRETLADRMTELSGRSITIHMIANWIAESHPHNFPAELIPTLCHASGINDPLQVQIDAVGIFTLPGADALRAEIQKLDEEVHELQAEKRKRLLFLQEMEGKRS